MGLAVQRQGPVSRFLLKMAVPSGALSAKRCSMVVSHSTCIRGRVGTNFAVPTLLLPS